MARSLYRHWLRSRRLPIVLAGALCAIAASPIPVAAQLPIHKSQIPQTQEPPVLVPPPMPTVQPKPLELPRHFETDATAVEKELDELIREAVRNNPDLTAAREAVAAAQHRVAPAGMPEDPWLGYRMKDLPTTFSMERENATEKQAEFQQRYPFPGKLTLREEIAAKRADQTREQMHAALVQLVTQVRSAFADVFLVDKDIQVSLEHQRRLRDLVDIATSKYKVGPGLQEDVLNADVALARIDSVLIELSRRRRSREIQLAVLLNQDRVEIPSLGALPAVGLKQSPFALEQMVLETNPDVREREGAVERDEKAVRLARMAPLPDIYVSAAYGSRVDHAPTVKVSKGKTTITETDRPDLLTGQIMFDIPVFYPWKQSEELQAAEADLRRNRARLEAARRKAVDSLYDLLARLAQHEQVAASFRDEVIPVARAEVSASISAYQVNRVDFLTLLAAQDNLDTYQTEYWRNEAERFRDLAEIDRVTGATLTEDGWSQ
jgi:cobalt-zinc-cadmium efflux system outer membrane protein